MDNTNEDITKAHTAIDCLLMAYSAMLDYSFQGAPELRSATMEIIHALEEAITSGMVDVELGGGYDDDDMYKKEIVQEDGQFCVYSADRSRSFGCYISRERAEERLAQIEQFSRHIKSVTTTNLAEAYNKTSESLAGSVIGILDTLMLEELEKRLTASTTTSFTPIMKAEQRKMHTERLLRPQNCKLRFGIGFVKAIGLSTYSIPRNLLAKWLKS